MLSSAVQYFLMLAVMQYSVWFFVAIILGLGVGELGFGRYCRASTSGLAEGMGRAARDLGSDGAWRGEEVGRYRDQAIEEVKAIA